MNPAGARPQRSRSRDASHSSSGGARPLRVLIVEDHRDTATVMQLMVEGWGHAVRVAHDGVSGLAIADEFRPDVVLLDIVMPKMHGHDLARRLKERSWAERLHLVAITAWGQQADREQSRAAGIHEHLLKPIEPLRLEELLRSCASRL